MDGWNTTFLFGRPIFRSYVSFRECNSDEKLVSSPLIPACPVQMELGFDLAVHYVCFFSHTCCVWCIYPNMISQCTVRLGMHICPTHFLKIISSGGKLVALARGPPWQLGNSMQGYGHEEVGKTFFMNLGWSPMFWVEVQCSGLKSNDCAHEKIDAAFVRLLYERLCSFKFVFFLGLVKAIGWHGTW